MAVLLSRQQKNDRAVPNGLQGNTEQSNESNQVIDEALRNKICTTFLAVDQLKQQIQSYEINIEELKKQLVSSHAKIGELESRIAELEEKNLKLEKQECLYSQIKDDNTNGSKWSIVNSLDTICNEKIC